MTESFPFFLLISFFSEKSCYLPKSKSEGIVGDTGYFSQEFLFLGSKLVRSFCNLVNGFTHDVSHRIHSRQNHIARLIPRNTPDLLQRSLYQIRCNDFRC
jgi:hypothetical protein